MRTICQSMVVLMLISGMTGCMSVLARRSDAVDPDIPRYVYPGVQLDCEAIASPFDAKAQTDALYAGFAYPLFLIGLIDLPFSTVLDTVCLPYDVYRVTFGRKTRWGEVRLPTSRPTVRGGPRP